MCGEWRVGRPDKTRCPHCLVCLILTTKCAQSPPGWGNIACVTLLLFHLLFCSSSVYSKTDTNCRAVDKWIPVSTCMCYLAGRLYSLLTFSPSTPRLLLIQALRAKQRWLQEDGNSKNTPEEIQADKTFSLPWDTTLMDSAYWFISSYFNA